LVSLLFCVLTRFRLIGYDGTYSGSVIFAFYFILCVAIQSLLFVMMICICIEPRGGILRKGGICGTSARIKQCTRDDDCSPTLLHTLKSLPPANQQQTQGGGGGGMLTSLGIAMGSLEPYCLFPFVNDKDIILQYCRGQSTRSPHGAICILWG